MPITNASNLIRFADGTGAEIPRWIRKQLQAYGDDSESIKALVMKLLLSYANASLQVVHQAYTFTQ